MAQPITISGVVERERLAEVLRVLPPTTIANVLGSWSLAAMMWDSVPHASLCAFIAVNTLVNLGRIVLARRWTRSGRVGRQPRRLLSLSWIGALLSGLCWAWILCACALHGQAYSVATGLAFCGINAGATVQNTASRAQVLAFILPNSAILVVLFASEGSLPSAIVAINLLLLTGLMIRGAGDRERHFLLSSRTRHEATDLARSLEAANIAAGKAMARLKHSAAHDPLTGLLNRAGYQAAFAARLSDAARDGGTFAVVLIDLDHFKGINDTHGHVIGDEVLVKVARRLRKLLGPDDVIARLGGDEFAALILATEADASATLLAQRLVEGLTTVVTPSGQTVQAGASVGFARYPRDGESLTELQVNADIALYAAKTSGRRTWRGFDPAMRRAAEMKRALERDLPRALAEEAIEVWFQPQVDCRTGRATGFEALLRWNHPVFGWVEPPLAVSAAEATRQSQALTRMILRRACRMIEALSADGHAETVVSINISPSEFGTYPIAEMVAAELAARRLDARRLAIEITEEAVYSTERGGSDIAALTRIGVGIIVDDFGVAYSSIGSLRSLPIGGLKIDRSFIQGLAETAQDRTLAQAILAFANTLGARVVAEGVETREQVEILRALGCPILQGYYFAKAMPEADALLWIARNDEVAGLERDTPTCPAVVAEAATPERT